MDGPDPKEGTALQLWQKMEREGMEELIFCHDPHSGLKAVIAIHSTVLGPALGGCRYWHYALEEDSCGSQSGEPITGDLKVEQQNTAAAEREVAADKVAHHKDKSLDTDVSRRAQRFRARGVLTPATVEELRCSIVLFSPCILL